MTLKIKKKIEMSIIACIKLIDFTLKSVFLLKYTGGFNKKLNKNTLKYIINYDKTLLKV